MSSYQSEADELGWDFELPRLASQLALSWPRERTLLGRLGLTDGAAVVELGCGPGLLAERLAIELPASRLVAIEADPALAAAAARRLGPHRRRARVICADAARTGIAGGAFDFVLARYLYQHLPDPAAVTREAMRLLRPGGRLAVIDIDAGLWGIVEPYNPLLPVVFQKAARLQASRGGDRLVGRRLWRILRDAGCAEPTLEAFVYHSDELGKAPFIEQLSPARLEPARAAGLLSEADLTMVEAAHRHFAAAPDAFVLMVGLLAHGRRP